MKTKHPFAAHPPVRLLLMSAVLLLLVVGVWAGCKSESKSASGIGPVGAYALMNVDGKNVPCTVKHEGHALSIRSGAFIFNPDGTCSSRIFISGRDTPIETTATYQCVGPELTMKWQRAGITRGSIKGDTFTMTNEGMVFAYRK